MDRFTGESRVFFRAERAPSVAGAGTVGSLGRPSSQIRAPLNARAPTLAGRGYFHLVAGAMRAAAVGVTKCGGGVQGDYCPAVSHARPPDCRVSRSSDMGKRLACSADVRLVIGRMPGVTAAITLTVEFGV